MIVILGNARTPSAILAADPLGIVLAVLILFPIADGETLHLLPLCQATFGAVPMKKRSRLCIKEILFFCLCARADTNSRNARRVAVNQHRMPDNPEYNSRAVTAGCSVSPGAPGNLSTRSEERRVG